MKDSKLKCEQSDNSYDSAQSLMHPDLRVISDIIEYYYTKKSQNLTTKGFILASEFDMPRTIDVFNVNTEEIRKFISLKKNISNNTNQALNKEAAKSDLFLK